MVTATVNNFTLWVKFPYKNGYWIESSNLLGYDAL